MTPELPQRRRKRRVDILSDRLRLANDETSAAGLIAGRLQPLPAPLSPLILTFLAAGYSLMGSSVIWLSVGIGSSTVSSISLAVIIFACAAGGAVVGMILRVVLPEAHLGSESRDVIKLGTGLVATMAALVLGLLIGSAKSAFDAQQSGLQQLATNVILLDRSLRNFGPRAEDVRRQLRATTELFVNGIGESRGGPTTRIDDDAFTAAGNQVHRAIQSLAPQNDFERTAQSQSLQFAAELARTRWTLSEQDTSTLPVAFLVVLAFWLFVLFSSFGLFSPRNPTVIFVLLVCAMSVAGAVFLIADLDQPTDGLIRVSTAPLQNALTQLGK